MNLPSCVLLCSVIVSSIYTAAVIGENANSKKNMPKKEEKGDIFIDGDELEGSGTGSIEGKNDLEFSGSGYGPDDEDSELDRADLFVSGSKTRIGMTNTNNGLRKVNTESNQDKLGQTSSMPSTPESVSTSKAGLPIIETDTKSQPIEPVNRNANSEKEHVGNEASNTEKTSVDDISSNNNNGVYVVNTPDRDRTTSFFAQPGILAAVIGGAVVGLLCAILVVMFIVYRMRKKDEGSYPLEEMKRCPATNPYIKPNHREFFA